MTLQASDVVRRDDCSPEALDAALHALEETYVLTCENCGYRGSRVFVGDGSGQLRDALNSPRGVLAKHCRCARCGSRDLEPSLEETTTASDDPVAEALIDLDKAVERVLLADLSSENGGLSDALHALDETRGRIWATYNAASDVLKAAAARRAAA